MTMAEPKKYSLPMMKVQGPGLLRYDLSNIPVKLRKRSNVYAASTSQKRRKCSDSNVLENGNQVAEDPDERQPDQSQLNVASSSSSISCSIPVEDDLKIYVLSLADCGYFCPCDATQTLFAIADYDKSSRQILKHKIHTVRRKTVNFVKNSLRKWIYYCSCNLVYADYVDSLGFNVHSSFHDFQERNCIHTEVLKQFSSSDVVNNLPDINQMDHSYGSTALNVNEEELLELPFGCDFCLATCGVMPGVVTIRVNKPQCYTCQSGYCSHKKLLMSYLKAAECETTPDCVCKLKRLLDKRENTKDTFIYSTVSKNPIKFRLSENMRQNFMKPFYDCISEDGIFQLFPFENDTRNCCTNPFEDTFELQEKTKIPFFNKYEVYDVSVYCRTCSCGNIQMFDGGELSVLNMKSFLIHHSLLRDYMWHFLFSRCTLYSYFNVWLEEMSDMGIDLIDKGMSYVKFRHSWYAFLDLLDIQYQEGFECNTCGSSPNVIICDATSLAFRKSFVTWQSITQSYNDGNSSLIEGSRHKDRIVVNKKKFRVLLKTFCDGTETLDENQFEAMAKGVISCFPAVEPLLQTLQNIGCFQSCPSEYRPLLELIASSSPACALPPCTADNEKLIKEMLAMDSDIAQNSTLLSEIQQKLPVVFDIIKSAGSILSLECKQILAAIFEKSKSTFAVVECKQSSYQDSIATSNENTSYFPALQRVRSRGYFKADKTCREDYDKCAKDSSRHPHLLPGIFTVFCEHGLCYGFQIMENNESPNVPFTFIRTRFLTAPSVIIYDNACNLHAYCLNRDPLFIKDTIFAVDNLHWRNHKSCSKVYHAKNLPALLGINTQMVEQSNAKLRKLKSQLSYMNHANFMNHLIFFLWHCNKKLKDQN
ncbi:uncharacterized protein LOC117320740 [Pecten maximus]|uniref:uncharacterized protein LOC117320740 n=1 Tax=Pecten maximus TaxID=6579 RepID=UPI001458088B|nr:uncharacterized protein LOC117320740 [Pecten maximus]